jgi:hypothetical protein
LAEYPINRNNALNISHAFFGKAISHGISNSFFAMDTQAHREYLGMVD